MAIYTTTTAELTSVADAIRAKTGGSSALVYPTGFVSAIEGITTSTATPYNYLGENATLLTTIAEESMTLADTSFPSWTPSTTATNLTTSAQVPNTSFYYSVDYDYILKITGYVKYAYTETVTTLAGLEYLMIMIVPFGQKPNTLSSLENNTYDYITYAGSYTNNQLIYYNSSGVANLTSNNYGIFLNPGVPSFSSQSSTTTFRIIPRTTTVRAVANANYVNTTALGKIDAQNTIINIKQELYKCESRNDVYHRTMAELKDLHTAINTSTT